MNQSPRRTAEQWQVLVDSQISSDLSAPAFCKEHQISYASFSQWRKRLAQSVPVTEDAPPVFVELTTAESPSSQVWAAELELGAGIVLRIARS